MTGLPALVVFTLIPALCIGCANPGPPKPPSLHLPQLVNDLAAVRVGDHVVLRWTTPSRTTDDMEIKSPMTAEICREMGDRPLTPAARLSACSPIRRLAVVPGASEFSDTLPTAFQAEPIALLTYRVQIFNSAGHSAGNSVRTFAAAGAVPAPISSLRATASEHGAILEWNKAGGAEGQAMVVDLKRTDLSASASATKRPKPASGAHIPGKGKSTKPPDSHEQKSVETHLRVADSILGSQKGTSGTIDATAIMGDTYTYVAQRVLSITLGGHALEIDSEPSPAVTLEMRDTFPPKVPIGLATISGLAAPDNAASGVAPTPYADLSWEPNEEIDLAGYRVYRQLARPDGSPQGPLARLTALPISAPAYRDVAVKAGQGYIYSVTAVDAAGNESAPSAKALEVLSSDAGEPLN